MSDPEPIHLTGSAFITFCEAARECGAVIHSVDTRHPGEYDARYYLPEALGAQGMAVASERMEEFREAA